jgi:zinc transport system substrate-binding protein
MKDGGVHKKKRAALALLLAGALGAWAGCGAGSQAPSTRAGLRIVTSFYPMYVFTANVTQGIEGVSVHNMAAPEVGCLHDYQLLPGDLRALEDADVLVINGAGMERFLDKVREQRRALPVVDASEGIALLVGEEDGEPEPNPHVWVDPRNAAAQARTIARRLGELDAAHAGAYAANAEAYAARLEALYARMRAALEGAPLRDILTFHEAFGYFAAAFDLNVTGVVEREPGSEPGTRDLTDLVDLIRGNGATALFAEPQYPPGAADIIAAETGRRVYTLDPAVTGRLEPTAYEDAMERNVATLLEALQ